MTPVALWTGRLPGLRPLPRKRTLWAVGAVLLGGVAGLFGLFGPSGAYVVGLSSLVGAWAVWRHRWPTELPVRLRSLEAPQGPDERAVMVEIRHEGFLLGWDVGILWFEKGGVGFVGRTASFVIPRSTMRPAPAPPAVQAALRAPQLQAKVHDTTVGIVPLAPEMRAEMTLARIEALPDAPTSETILPPDTMHPELLQRAHAVRRRLPVLVAYNLLSAILLIVACFFHRPQRDLLTASYGVVGILIVLFLGFYGVALPRPVRERLPK